MIGDNSCFGCPAGGFFLLGPNKEAAGRANEEQDVFWRNGGHEKDSRWQHRLGWGQINRAFAREPDWNWQEQRNRRFGLSWCFNSAAVGVLEAEYTFTGKCNAHNCLEF